MPVRKTMLLLGILGELVGETMAILRLNLLMIVPVFVDSIMRIQSHWFETN